MAIKRTVPDLALFIAEATGLDASHLRTVARRLREADYLSQAGHGRGAAAATPTDAALLLLTSILGVPSLHVVRIGEAIIACTIGTMTDAEVDEVAIDDDAVDHVAGLIATGKDVDLIHIVLRGDDLGVIISAGETSYHYQMSARSPIRSRLAKKFGQPGRVVRTYRGEIRDGVLPEISEFLGFGAEDAA